MLTTDAALRPLSAGCAFLACTLPPRMACAFIGEKPGWPAARAAHAALICWARLGASSGALSALTHTREPHARGALDAQRFELRAQPGQGRIVGIALVPVSADAEAR